jgi:hypothetical protein
VGHLDQDRPDVFHALGRHVLAMPNGECARVRPLGVGPARRTTTD